MKRRTFLQQSGRALAAAPFLSLSSLQAIPPAILRRIGITTVCFREQFQKTKGRGVTIPPGQELTLLTAPKYFADTLGLHNVEIWNFQFDEESIDYCKKIKAAAEAVGSRIINLQLDLGPADTLSDPDAAKRATASTAIKAWMDRTAATGATMMRANTGPGTPANWNLQRTADEFRKLAEYGKTIGVTILIENHIGYSEDIDKVVAIVKAVNHPNCKTLCDWGNSPAGGTPQQKVDALAKLFPNMGLVSAKQLDFDAQNKHIDYDVVPIIKATEAAGYKGIYSIEFYTINNKPPKDVVAAAKVLLNTIAANIKA